MKVRASVKPDLRQVQGDSSPRSGARDLQQSEAQAAAGIKVRRKLWHVSQVSIFRRKSACGWASRPSTASGGHARKSLAEKANVDFDKKIRDLTEDETNRLRQEIEKEGRVEGDLRKEIQMNIRRLIEVQAYRGIRHRRNLPVRGQRNAHQCANPQGTTARRGRSQEKGNR